MAMYWTCQYGANHDCGEKCDCKIEEKKREDYFAKALRIESAGQMSFLWNGKEASYAIKSVS